MKKGVGEEEREEKTWKREREKVGRREKGGERNGPPMWDMWGSPICG